ncbi:MAG: hypothetical protein KDA91_01495 [Planctomycetaceae bacterium]|nr:hypothetical protein [Planctomycetaceae bacterium]
MNRQRQTIELLQLLGDDVAEAVLAQLNPSKASVIREGISKPPGEVLFRPKRQRAILDEFDEFFQFALRAGLQKLYEKPADDELSDTENGKGSGDGESDDESAEPGPPVFELTGDPIVDLRSLSISQLGQALETEQPRTSAILLANLEPKLAADTLSVLPDDYRQSVVKELSREQHAPQILVERIARATLQRGRSLSPEPPDRREHVDRLADVLRSVPKNQRMAMVNAIEEQDAELHKALMKKMYRFDDLLNLDGKLIQRILGEIDGTTLTTALFNAPANIRESVLTNLSRRARQSIEEEMEFMTQVPESRIREARESVAEVIARVDQETE